MPVAAASLSQIQQTGYLPAGEQHIWQALVAVQHRIIAQQ